MVRALESQGYQVQLPVRDKSPAYDFTKDEVDILARVKPFTMVDDAAIIDLCRATEYIERRSIPGAVVECGVYRGGGMMAVALTLQRLKARRELYLFDTFEGMSAPTDVDRSYKGEAASDIAAVTPDWAAASLEAVTRNMESTGYDRSLVHYIKGKVEDTLPGGAPAHIALLRLDTDWYESTYHELVHLYPRLAAGGPLLIDDYGHWEGCRRAVDEYFDQHQVRAFLSRVTPSVRSTTKAC